MGITFVIGPPRSGTTLLKDLLAAHPGLDVHGEDFHGFHHDLSCFPTRVTKTEHYYLTSASALQNIRVRYKAAIADSLAKTGKTHFVCKISTLSIQVDYLRCLFPEARFIQMVRDGRDTMLSMEDLRQALGPKQRTLGPAADPLGLRFAERFPGAPPVLRAAASWAFHVMQSSIDLRFAGTDLYRRYRYEDLVARPREVLAAAFAFIGVEWPTQNTADETHVDNLLNGVRDVPHSGESASTLGFSTCGAEGPRLGRHTTELLAPHRVLSAPLLLLPMRILGYAADPWPYADDFEKACGLLSIDFNSVRNFVKDVNRWGSVQLECFSPEHLLKRNSDLSLKDTDRPVLISGAEISWRTQAHAAVLGATTEHVGCIQKQIRQYTFADPSGLWPQLASLLNGHLSWSEIQERLKLMKRQERAQAEIVQKLCTLGFCGIVPQSIV